MLNIIIFVSSTAKQNRTRGNDQWKFQKETEQTGEKTVEKDARKDEGSRSGEKRSRKALQWYITFKILEMKMIMKL